MEVCPRLLVTSSGSDCTGDELGDGARPVVFAVDCESGQLVKCLVRGGEVAARELHQTALAPFSGLGLPSKPRTLGSRSRARDLARAGGSSRRGAASVASSSRSASSQRPSVIRIPP